MNETKHTPTESDLIMASPGPCVIVAKSTNGQVLMDMTIREIVRDCNSHASLVAACENLIRLAHKSTDGCPFKNAYAPISDCQCNYHADYHAARAAIAQAVEP